MTSLREVYTGNGASLSVLLEQSDTYFKVPKGRLKLREVSGRMPELIFYERNESSASEMESHYEILQIQDPALKDFLAKALGVRVVVEKERQLLMLENARIHLDKVKNLGTFLEFEVVSSENVTGEEGKRRDADLLDKLKGYAAPFVVREINESYSDMMLRL